MPLPSRRLLTRRAGATQPEDPTPQPQPGVRALYEGDHAFRGSLLTNFGWAASEYDRLRAQLVASPRSPDSFAALASGNLHAFKHAVGEIDACLAVLDETGDLAMMDHVVRLVRAAYPSLTTRWVRRPDGQWATAYRSVLEPSGSHRFWLYHGADHHPLQGGRRVDPDYYGTNLLGEENWHWYGCLANVALALKHNIGKSSPGGFNYQNEYNALIGVLDEFEALWMGVWGAFNDLGAVRMSSRSTTSSVARLRYHVFRNLCQPRASDRQMAGVIAVWLRDAGQTVPKTEIPDGVLVLPHWLPPAVAEAGGVTEQPPVFALTEPFAYVVGGAYHLALAGQAPFDGLYLRRLANTIEHCVLVDGTAGDLAWDIGGGGPSVTGLARTDPRRQRVSFRDRSATAAGVSRYTQEDTGSASPRLAYTTGLERNLWLLAKYTTGGLNRDTNALRGRLSSHDHLMFDKAGLLLRHLDQQGWQRDGDNTRPAPEPAPNPSPTPEPPPAQPATGVPLQALSDFSPSRDIATHQQRQLHRAFVLGLAKKGQQGFVPSLEGMYSALRPNVVCMYRLRLNKRYVNGIRAVLKLIPDPDLVGAIYDAMLPVIGGLRYEWTTWNSQRLPGEADGNNIVIDPYSNDHGKRRWNGKFGSEDNGGDRSEKGAYARWFAWRGGRKNSDNTWTSGTNLTGGDRFRSPDFRERRHLEMRQYKKLLYMSEDNWAGGIRSYGTHLHLLDNFLAHSFIFWGGYVLDANRHLDRAYASAADTLFDYAFNHWVPLTQAFAPRNNTTGCFSLSKSLHHNVAAHASIYDAFVHWKRLPHRGGQADPVDLKALRSMMSYILGGFSLHAVPSSYSKISNPSRYAIANWGHANKLYADAHGTGAVGGPAVTVYGAEHISELINLYLSGAKATNGDELTPGLMSNLSLTYGLIVEAPEFSGSTWINRVATNISASSDNGGSVKRAFLDDGTAVNVTFGGSRGTAYAYESGFGRTPIKGHPRWAAMGGYLHAFDPTPELYALRQWARRGQSIASSAWRCNVKTLINNPADSSNSSWEWVCCYLMTSLLRPQLNWLTLNI